MRTCKFALFHFGLSWLTQLAWLAPAEYAKVQSCSFAFLYVCTFALSPGRGGTAGNAKAAKMLEHAKNTNFALFHFFWYGWPRHGKDVVAGTSRICWPQPNMQKCKAAVLHFCTFSWESWHSWQCKTAKNLEHARTQTLHFSTFSNTAGMGKARMWWLAQAEYAKVHLHFCIFGWCGWHGQSKGGVVGAGRICKSAILRFRLYGWHG